MAHVEARATFGVERLADMIRGLSRCRPPTRSSLPSPPVTCRRLVACCLMSGRAWAWPGARRPATALPQQRTDAAQSPGTGPAWRCVLRPDTRSRAAPRSQTCRVPKSRFRPSPLVSAGSAGVRARVHCVLRVLRVLRVLGGSTSSGRAGADNAGRCRSAALT